MCLWSGQANVECVFAAGHHLSGKVKLRNFYILCFYILLNFYKKN